MVIVLNVETLDENESRLKGINVRLAGVLEVDVGYREGNEIRQAGSLAGLSTRHRDIERASSWILLQNRSSPQSQSLS